MTLSEFIQDGVVCFLEAKDRNDALHQLVDSLGETGEIKDRQSYFEAILKREEIVSTGIGMGVAIPHAKQEGFEHFFLAVGIQKAKEGLEWDSLDGAPVRLIFMIGGPAKEQTEYLKILSHLTAAIKDEERRTKILSATTREEVVALFTDIP